jgi:hypothetical protein
MQVIPSRGQRVRPPATLARQRAAIEKALSRYVRMTCGHLTSPEVIILYECFAPDKISVFCENCEGWSSLLPRAPRVPLPDEPLF